MAERPESTDPAIVASDTRTQIEEGITTNPSILNHYFSAMIAWERSSAAKESGVYKEAHGERILQYIKALNGSYQKEKARFCLAQAEDHFSRASLNDTAEPPSESAIPEQESASSSQQQEMHTVSPVRPQKPKESILEHFWQIFGGTLATYILLFIFFYFSFPNVRLSILLAFGLPGPIILIIMLIIYTTVKFRKK